MTRYTLVALLVVLITVPTVAEAGFSRFAGKPFCRERIVRDFTAPLRKLPAIHQVPQSGQLRFAPARVSFSSEASEILTRGYPITYTFLSGKPVPKLHWQVTSRLLRINRNGDVLRIVKRKIESVRFSKAKPYTTIGFSRSGRPGLYRYDIIFRKAGRLLGRYHDYYRLVQRSTDVHLRLNSKLLQTGDRIVGQIENFTVEPVAYESFYRIQRYEGENWLPVPLEELFGYPVRFFNRPLGVFPGSAGPCFEVMTVPEAMRPGRYRIVKLLNVRFRRLRIDPRPITAEFRVMGSLY